MIFPRFCCPGHAVLFPEFFVKGKTEGEAIDFFLESKKWDIELLRNRNRLVEHMERFQEGGGSMIDTGQLWTWARSPIIHTFEKFLGKFEHLAAR